VSEHHIIINFMIFASIFSLETDSSQGLYLASPLMICNTST